MLSIVILLTVVVKWKGPHDKGFMKKDSPEKQLRMTIRSMWRVLSQQDQAKFQNYCSPGWRLYTARGSRFDVDKLFSIHKENIQDFQLQPSNFEIHHKPQLTWVTYDAQMSALFKGEPWGGDFIMTGIYEKRRGNWVCVHMHESKKPKE